MVFLFTPINIRSVAIVSCRVSGRPLQGELLFKTAGFAICRLPVSPQPAGTDVLLLAAPTRVGSFVGVEPFVKFQVNELSELGRTQVAGVGLLPRMEPQVRLEVRSAAEPLLANVALVGLLSGVHQVVLLKVGQLRETLGAHVAFERSLPGVRPQVHLHERKSVSD